MIKVQQHGPVTAIRMARSLLGRPIYWTAAYWIDGLLIDSGPPCTARELAQTLAAVHVDQIVVTHAHEDHIGGLPMLTKQFPGAAIYANWQTLPFLADPELLRMHAYRKLLWGKPSPVSGVKLVGNAVATTSHRFRVIETPGHSRDHISLFEPTHGWLFCADAYSGGQERACSPDMELFGVVSSLRSLSALHPRSLFPGSGNVRRAAEAEIQGKIVQLLALCTEVSRLDAKNTPMDQMVRHLFGREPGITLWTRGHYSAANLISACRNYNTLVDPAAYTLPSSALTRPSRRSQPPTGDYSTGETTDYSDFNDLIR